MGQPSEDYVRAQLETGRYDNASEVIREALRLKMQADEERAARLEAVRRDIADARQQVRTRDHRDQRQRVLEAATRSAS
jgi:antitoxin ParD1/3/4